MQLALADLGGRIDFGVLEEEQTALADFVMPVAPPPTPCARI